MVKCLVLYLKILINIGIDVGIDLGYLIVSLYGSNDCKLEGFFPRGQIGSTDSKVIVSDEVIKL